MAGQGTRVVDLLSAIFQAIHCYDITGEKRKGTRKGSENSNLEASKNRQIRQEVEKCPGRNTGEQLRMAILMPEMCLKVEVCSSYFPHVVKEYTASTRVGRFILTHSSGNTSSSWGWGQA